MKLTLEKLNSNKRKMIINQSKIPKKVWRYGLRSSAATGCGWIATYNALQLLGYYVQPERLIRYYERACPVINGNFGTLFLSPIIFWRHRGFQVKVSFRRKRFDELVKNSAACILLYSWRRKWKIGAHYVALHQREDRVIGYNTFTDSKGPDQYGESVEAFLKRRKYFLPMLIAIQNRESESSAERLGGEKNVCN